jgi:hypothetical protein
MNQVQSLTRSLTGAGNIVRSAAAGARDPGAIASLSAQLGPEDLELVILFISPEADIDHVTAEARIRFAPTRVIGCTTAGELTDQGYSEGEIVAIGLPRAQFHARLLPVPDLTTYDRQDLVEALIRNRNDMARDTPDWPSEFSFLLVDGLSVREDALTADLAPGLGPVPLFGGSSGDGADFGRTYVIHDGAALSNAAVIAQIRSRCGIKVFNTDHMLPTERRMVVTGADPARRIVHEINAEPAAREYARLLGKDPEQLSTFIFAAHPVVVRVGGKHHVRSIQRVADNGDLVFFSVIDEGVVLTLAEPQDMVSHLERELAELHRDGTPDIILACDCVLRKVEAEQKQMTTALSRLMADNRVVGFSTYGEQVNSLHVNQTLTGVAIYPPTDDPEGG